MFSAQLHFVYYKHDVITNKEMSLILNLTLLLRHLVLITDCH